MIKIAQKKLCRNRKTARFHISMSNTIPQKGGRDKLENKEGKDEELTY